MGNEKPLEADCGNDAKVTNTLNVHETRGDDDGDFLAFWDDSIPEEEDEKRLGSMAYFNRAAAKFKAIGCGECVREGPDVLSVRNQFVRTSTVGLELRAGSFVYPR